VGQVVGPTAHIPVGGAGVDIVPDAQAGPLIVLPVPVVVKARAGGAAGPVVGIDHQGVPRVVAVDDGVLVVGVEQGLVVFLAQQRVHGVAVPGGKHLIGRGDELHLAAVFFKGGQRGGTGIQTGLGLGAA